MPWYSSVNGKNSYGGYTGEKWAVCYFDMQESRIVDMTLP